MAFVSERVLSAVLGRGASFFAEAVQANKSRLAEAIVGRRILVIGAGGSIGSAFVKVLAEYRPAALHLVDLSENSLVHLVRELHGQGIPTPREFATCAVGFDEPEFYSFLESVPPFDYALNFAALKHVRSERDPFTAMRLLRINVLANDALMRRLSDSPPSGYFCVSSDKAVNPASLMGASKAFMERVCLARADSVPFRSARFANVAFSEGSLLQSFCQRLESGQPFAGPNDVRRYFISHREAGELCLMSCFLGLNREIFTPLMEPGRDLKTFPEIAEIILRDRGLRPVFCESEREAVERAATRKPESSEWPCYFSPSNTSGEKPFEEFYSEDEEVLLGRLPNVAVVTRPRTSDPARIGAAVGVIESWRRLGSWSLEGLLDQVRSVVPEFQHVEGAANLDQKL